LGKMESTPRARPCLSDPAPGPPGGARAPRPNYRGERSFGPGLGAIGEQPRGPQVAAGWVRQAPPLVDKRRGPPEIFPPARPLAHGGKPAPGRRAESKPLPDIAAVRCRAA